MINHKSNNKFITKAQEFVDNHFFWSFAALLVVLFTLTALLSPT